jgi:signal transduction histidine kinase
MAELTQRAPVVTGGTFGGTTSSATATEAEALAGSSERVSQQEARRRVGHDIRHELSTIMLLASVLSEAPELGVENQQRAHQLLGEARWLDELLRAYERALTEHGSDDGKRSAPLRADAIVLEVVAPIRMGSTTRLIVEARPAWVFVDRLVLWRALRNVIVNAVEAAGEHGTVIVRVDEVEGGVVIDVKDDGPGFAQGAVTETSLGLSIAFELVQSWHGELTIRRSELGGSAVRMVLPSAYPDRRVAGAVGE